MLGTKEKTILLGFLIYILISIIGFTGHCEKISNKILRLHIIANSNSEEDQILKLKIRDKILENYSNYFKNTNNLEEIKNIFNNNIKDIENTIKKEIKKNGYDYETKIEIKKIYFNTRAYNQVILPAGNYDAVRITIGSGKGKNWWCVMFPPMCLPAAQEQHELNEILNPVQMNIVQNKDEYEIKFMALELFEKSKNFMNLLSVKFF